MNDKVLNIVSNIVGYEILGSPFVVNALMNEANRAIKHYAENGDTPGAVVDPKSYALVAENVKQQLNKYLEENK